MSLVLAYGYEVLSFTLTLDEELFAAGVRDVFGWIAEGRWSMAVLFLLMPSAIVPVVSTGLGVGLSGVAWWLLSRKFLGMNPWQSAFAASLAATIPTLAFIFSFSTIAYGIGVANLLLVGYTWGICSRLWLHRALGIFAGAAAIGIYDSFLLALAALSLAFIIRHSNLAGIGLGIAAVPVTFVVSRSIGDALQMVTNVTQAPYVSGFIDPRGLLTDPVGRTSRAASDVWHTISLSTERFGLHSPWLVIALTVLTVLAFFGVLRTTGTRSERVIRVIALVCVLLIPVAAEAISPASLNLRSMIYLPIIALVLAAAASTSLPKMPKVSYRIVAGTLVVVVILTVVGNSTITNRLFASAAATYALDQKLAFAIGYEKDRLQPEGAMASMPIVISGMHEWPETSLIPTRETLGVSFFERSSAYSIRVVSFLRTQGIDVRAATASETRRAQPAIGDMPAYPRPGWVEFNDGVLLVQFENE